MSTATHQFCARTSANFYALSNLPLKTQHLLSSHGEFLSVSEALTLRRLNREIQVYQSLPGQASATVVDTVAKHHLSLIDAHLAGSDVYANMRILCARQAHNCDLNVINLNYPLSSSTAAAAAASDSLASNLYYRRALGQAILSELLDTKLHQSAAGGGEYLPGYNLFQILLSEAQFKQESVDGLLCPEFILPSDYKQVCESSSESALFAKWYRNGALSLDFLHMTSKDLAELSRLAALLVESGDSTFRLKYVKSIQQEEIEHIVKHADANSVIWVNLKGAASSSATTCTDLNRERYEHVLRLLQTKVLTHNWKQIESNEGEVRKNSVQLVASQNLTLDEFLTNAMRYLIESFMRELNKNYFRTFALSKIYSYTYIFWWM